MGLCPPVTDKNAKPNFYLRSLNRTTPAQWYSNCVLGIHALRKTIGQLLKHSELDAFFSNHSLHRKSTTRLFNAGVDRKLVKEFTGHASDAIDGYQITSHSQREQISNIMSGRHSVIEKPISVKPDKGNEDNENVIEIQVKKIAL